MAVKKVTKKKLLQLLNKDLEWEFAAAVQYIQHSATLTGAQYESIIKELVIHSTEEMQHALALSEQIDYLGGVPTVNIEERAISDDSFEMLEQGLRGEADAIRRYKERIEQAELLKEYGLRRVLEDILVMEEEHWRDIKTMLDG